LLAARFQGGEVAIQAAGNCIYIPLDNFLKNQAGQSRSGQFCRGIKEQVNNQFAWI
jgi:hypothetical protein